MQKWHMQNEELITITKTNFKKKKHDDVFTEKKWKEVFYFFLKKKQLIQIIFKPSRTN